MCRSAGGLSFGVVVLVLVVQLLMIISSGTAPVRCHISTSSTSSLTDHSSSLNTSHDPASDLSEDFYLLTCPEVYDIVNTVVLAAVALEPRMAASLLRLHFHDCWIHGCDASVLLDNVTSLGLTSEKCALPNIHSLRGFHVVDTIKAILEHVCPQTVSCADILVIAARDAVVAVGGPFWEVTAGRRDSLIPFCNLANARGDPGLPSPFAQLTETISNFQFRGFSPYEMTVLSGAHTIGRAKCAVITRHLNDSDINPILRSKLLQNCSGTNTGLVPNNLDNTTPDIFDNAYYSNLLDEFGVLRTDQNLYSTPGASNLTELVNEFSSFPDTFLDSFSDAIIKMGQLSPLTGDDGEIRVNCRTPNGDSNQNYAMIE